MKEADVRMLCHPRNDRPGNDHYVGCISKKYSLIYFCQFFKINCAESVAYMNIYVAQVMIN